MAWKTIICDYCGKEKRREQRTNQNYYKHSFCGHKCEGKYRSTSKIINCLNCGKERKITKWLFDHTKHHFCSRKCFLLYHREKRKVKCAFCGKSFELSRSKPKEQTRFFCTIKCSGKSIRKSLKLKDYKELPYEWGYLLGTLCSDGYISETGSLALLVKDEDFANQFLNVIKKISGIQYNKKLRLNRKSYLWCVQIWNKTLCEELLKIGRYGGSTWEVPKIVIFGDLEIQIGFLNAFFDGEGTIAQGRNGRLSPTLSLISLNQKGLIEIAQLLTIFKINHTMNRRFNKKYKKFYYTLSILRKQDVMAYWEKIGISMPRKKADFISKLKKYLTNVQYQLQGYKRIEGFGVKIKPLIKFCAICGGQFTPKRPYRIYCSPECKEIGHKKTSSEYYYRKKKERLYV